MDYNKSQLKELDVSFGYNGIKLFPADRIEKEQLGYSIHPNGESLVGSEEGDWQSTWIVIGHTTDLGEPIFVDTCSEDLPVFTAMHGQGSWEPVIIADTYQALLNIMGEFSKLSKNRENPKQLENSPVTQEEYDNFISYVRNSAQISDIYFWELLASDEKAGIGPEI